MEMPNFGLGTYRNEDPDQCTESVATAIEVGYRHVDTAQMYDNEAAVGDGIDATGVDRDDLYVATKLEPSNLGREDVLETARESADRLGVDAIDLLYVHWPTGEYDPEETLPALDELREEGVVDRIGLSNFEPDQLDEANDHLDAPIAAHQIELHPLLQQEELREYAETDGHRVVAYSPIARNEVSDVAELREVAEKYDATPAQVSLAWLVEKDVVPIPKATGREHIVENFGALDIDLDAEDVERIDGIEREERLVDPDDAPWNR